jgi:hypothetical protein
MFHLGLSQGMASALPVALAGAELPRVRKGGGAEVYPLTNHGLATGGTALWRSGFFVVAISEWIGTPRVEGLVLCVLATSQQQFRGALSSVTTLTFESSEKLSISDVSNGSAP